MNELTDMCCGCRFSGDKEICHGDCLHCDATPELKERAAEFDRVCQKCWEFMKNGMSVDEALSDENVEAAIAAAREQT